MQQLEQRPIFVVDRKTALAIGAAAGAIIGATVAYVYVRADESSRASGLGKVQIIGRHIDSADYIRLGVALVALVRLVAGMIKSV